MRSSFLVLLAVAAAAPLAAQEPSERLHEVRPGDTLWDLARQYLGDPFLWPEIFRANQDRVADPDRIFPAARLRIPGVGDRVAADVAPGAAAPVAEAGAGQASGVTGTLPRGAFGRTVFAAREEAPRPASTVRTIQADEVPLVLPGDFYRAGLLVPESEVVALGRVVGPLNPSLVPMKIPARIALYDRIFVTVAAGAARVGDRVQIVHQEREVEPYGWVFVTTGMATVLALDGNVATAEVVEVYGKIDMGNLVVAVPPAPTETGVDPVPAAGPEGTLVAFESPHVLQGPQDRGFVDLGREAGLAPGDELLVYLPPRQERWGVRPEIEVARLQVVRVADRTATVRVLHLQQPALEPGLPVRQVARAP